MLFGGGDLYTMLLSIMWRQATGVKNSWSFLNVYLDRKESF